MCRILSESYFFKSFVSRYPRFLFFPEGIFILLLQGQLSTILISEVSASLPTICVQELFFRNYVRKESRAFRLAGLIRCRVIVYHLRRMHATNFYSFVERKLTDDYYQFSH